MIIDLINNKTPYLGLFTINFFVVFFFLIHIILLYIYLRDISCRQLWSIFKVLPLKYRKKFITSKSRLIINLIIVFRIKITQLNNSFLKAKRGIFVRLKNLFGMSKSLSFMTAVWYLIGLSFLFLGRSLRSCFLRYCILKSKVKKLLTIYHKNIVYFIFYVLFFFLDCLIWVYDAILWYIEINGIQIIFFYNSRIRDKLILWSLGDYSHLSFKQKLRVEKICVSQSKGLQNLQKAIGSLKFRFISVFWKIVLFVPTLKIIIVERYYIRLSEKIFEYWGHFFDKLEVPLIEALSYKATYLGSTSASDIFQGKVNLLDVGSSKGFLREQLYSTADHWGLNITTYPEHLDNQTICDVTTYFMDTRHTEAEQMIGQHKMSQEILDSKIKVLAELKTNIERCSEELVNLIPEPFDRESFYKLLKMCENDRSFDDRIKEILYNGAFGDKLREYKVLLNAERTLMEADTKTLVKTIKELKGSDLFDPSFDSDYELQEKINFFEGYNNPASSVEDVHLVQELLYWVKLPFTMFTLLAIVMLVFVVFSKNRKYLLNAPDYFGASLKAKLNGVLIYFMFLTGMEYFVFRFLMFLFVRFVFLVYINVYENTIPRYDLSYEMPIIEPILPKDTVYNTLGERVDNLIIGQDNVFVDFDNIYYLNQDKKLLSYYEDMLRLVQLRHRIPQDLNKDLNVLNYNKSQTSFDFFSEKSHLQSLLQQRNYLLPSSPIATNGSLFTEEELGLDFVSDAKKLTSLEERGSKSSEMYSQGSTTKNLYSFLYNDLNNNQIKLGDIHSVGSETSFINNLGRNFILMSHNFKEWSPEVTHRVNAFYERFGDKIIEENDVYFSGNQKLGQKIINGVDGQRFSGGEGLQWDYRDFVCEIDLFDYENITDSVFFGNPMSILDKGNKLFGLSSIFGGPIDYKVQLFPTKDHFEIIPFYSKWGFVKVENCSFLCEDLFGIPYEVVPSSEIVSKRLISSEIDLEFFAKRKSFYTEFSDFYNLLKKAPWCRSLVAFPGKIFRPEELEFYFLNKLSNISSDMKEIVGHKGYIKDLGELHSRTRDLNCVEQVSFYNMYDYENLYSMLRGLPVGGVPWLNSIYANLVLEDVERTDRGNPLFGNIEKDIISENKDILLLSYEYQKQQYKNYLLYASGQNITVPPNYFSITCSGIEKYYSMNGVTDCFDTKNVGYFLGGYKVQERVSVTDSLRNLFFSETLNHKLLNASNQVIKYFGYDLNMYGLKEKIRFLNGNQDDIGPGYLSDSDSEEASRLVTYPLCSLYEYMLDDYHNILEELEELFLDREYLEKNEEFAEDDNDMVDLDEKIGSKYFEAQYTKYSLEWIEKIVPEKYLSEFKNYINKLEPCDVNININISNFGSEKKYEVLALNNVVDKAIQIHHSNDSDLLEFEGKLMAGLSEKDILTYREVIETYQYSQKLIEFLRGNPKTVQLVQKFEADYVKDTCLDGNYHNAISDRQLLLLKKAYEEVKDLLEQTKVKLDKTLPVLAANPESEVIQFLLDYCIVRYDILETYYFILGSELTKLNGALDKVVDVNNNDNNNNNDVNNNAFYKNISHHNTVSKYFNDFFLINLRNSLFKESSPSLLIQVDIVNKELCNIVARQEYVKYLHSKVYERVEEQKFYYADFLRNTEDPESKPEFRMHKEAFELLLKQHELISNKEVYLSLLGKQKKEYLMELYSEVEKSKKRASFSLPKQEAGVEYYKTVENKKVEYKIFDKEIKELEDLRKKEFTEFISLQEDWAEIEAIKADPRATGNEGLQKTQQTVVNLINTKATLVKFLDDELLRFKDANQIVMLDGPDFLDHPLAFEKEKKTFISLGRLYETESGNEVYGHFIEKNVKILHGLVEKYNLPQSSLVFLTSLIKEKVGDTLEESMYLWKLEKTTLANFIQLSKENPNDDIYIKYINRSSERIVALENAIKMHSKKIQEESPSEMYVLRYLEEEKERLKKLWYDNPNSTEIRKEAIKAGKFYAQSYLLVAEVNKTGVDRPFAKISSELLNANHNSLKKISCKYVDPNVNFPLDMDFESKKNLLLNKLDDLEKEKRTVITQMAALKSNLGHAEESSVSNDKFMDLYVRNKVLDNKIRNISHDLNNIK